MKIKLFTLILFCLSLQVFAQKHPLGTWEVVSIKGVDMDGSKMVADSSQFKETKVITPTHYILITQRKQEDSLVFDKAIAGTVQVVGKKYIEKPIYYSDEAHGKAKTNFVYKLEGDKFIQSGNVTTPEGKVTTIDELVFQKVKTANFYPNNPAIGTWNQLSSKGVDANGKVLWSHTNATHIRYHIHTPDYWMRISMKGNEFENAGGGTYRMEGDTKVIPNFELMPGHPYEVITQRVEGNKLYWHLVIDTENGKIMVDDVFEKAD